MKMGRIKNYYSLQNFDLIKHSLKGKRLMVYNQIKAFNRPVRMEEVAASMNADLNCISGRFTELDKLGLIKRTGQTKNSKGNPCSLYSTVNIELNLFNQLLGED